MFNYDMRDIINAASSLAVFRRGFDYYKEQKVLKFVYHKELDRAFAKVDGSELYHVDITYQKGTFTRAYCECRAFHEYPGYCKHIVAALLHGKLNEAIGSDQQDVDHIVDYYLNQDFDDQVGTQPIQVDYTLSIRPFDYSGLLSIKMGLDQMYVLKDPMAFIKGLDDLEPYNFGKKFTFDPYIHTLLDKDKKVLEFLEQVLEYQTFFDLGRIKKDILLSPYQVKNILKLMKDPFQFQITHETELETVTFKKSDIKVIFDFEKKEDHFELDFSSMNEFTMLDDDDRLLFKDKVIYQITKRQSKELKPFFEMIQDGVTHIQVSEEQLNGLMAYLYPILNRTNDVNISQTLQNQLSIDQCEPKLYLDRDEDKIVAKLKYCYGEHIYDSFKGLETAPTEKIILRDLKLENKVMHIMESSAFKVSTEGYYIDDEYDIFLFLTEYINRLQKDVTVYYSEEFKRIKVTDYESISFSSSLDESMAYFTFQFSVDGLDVSDMSHLIQQLKKKKNYHRLKDGSFINLNHEAFDQFQDVLIDLDLSGKDFNDGMIQLPSYLTFYFDEKLDAIKHERDESFMKLIDQISKSGTVEFDVPTAVSDKLRSYQIQGFNWLKTLGAYHLGGILADDMGLGKTIQTLSYLQSQKDAGQLKCALIVAPTSLVYNWQNEVGKFFSDLRVLVIDGTKKQRTEKLSHYADYDLIITSYALVRNDQSLYQELPLDVCIIDEAQHIKNPSSKTAKAVKSLNVKNKFALTGTPIENSILELWSIFDFIMPAYLGTLHQFKAKYEKPLKEADSDQVQALKTLIKPFILRRLKKDVLKELPDKIENKVVVDLHDEQKKIYMAYLNEVKADLAEAYKTQGYQKSQMDTLAALTRLRQLCLHPGLFMDDFTGSSAKLDLLKELLEELIAGKHKVLIFSQFTSMLKIIKDLLATMNIDYLSLDGSTKAKTRHALVEEFNESDIPVFLISLKAGGTGLNLTGADTVIHFDPWWNPAVEDQATDRAHRIGQKKKVHVLKLVTKGTIEEKIYALQEKKKALIEQVIQPGETLISKLSEDEIRALFT